MSLHCPGWTRRKPEDLPLDVLIDEDLAQQLCDELWLGCLTLISCCPSERVSCVLENAELIYRGTETFLSSGVPTVAAAQFGDAMLRVLCQGGRGAGRATITLPLLCTSLPGPAC